MIVEQPGFGCGAKDGKYERFKLYHCIIGLPGLAQN